MPRRSRGTSWPDSTSGFGVLRLELGDRALAALILENTLLGYDVVVLRCGVRPQGRLVRRVGVAWRITNLRNRHLDFRRLRHRGRRNRP